MTTPIKVAVVGGGWAGLACAAQLVDPQHQKASPSASQVCLFEAAPQLGGRARGLPWILPDGRSLVIDNGQHLAIGAYTKTFALLNKVNAPAWQREPLVWSGLSRNEIRQHWRVPSVGWPWRLIQSAIPGRGPSGWPFSWARVMPRVLWALTRPDAHQTPFTAEDWLIRQGVPADFIAHLWRPLIEGALNTELSSASASVMVRVLKDSLLGASNATDVLTPTTDLSHAGVTPIADWLLTHGAQIKCSHRVRQIQVAPLSSGSSVAVPRRFRLAIDHHGQEEQQTFDRVVMALPAPATAALWYQSGLPETPSVQRLREFRHRAITTIWIALSEDDIAAIAHLPSWFVLNPVDGVPHLAQVAVKRPGVLALVMSAQDPEQSASLVRRESHESILRDQIKVQLGIELNDQPQKWITEKSATWACTPTAPIANPQDALGYTGIDGLFRCADDLEPGYPATIESAVRSGERSADTLIASLRC